jgi:DNA/RNA-binding domain of Phe-tRNA-synthetase-like protein
LPPLTLTVEAEVEVVALELRELEVTEPRADFTPVVEAAVEAARAGRVWAGTDSARALFRRFGIDPTKTRPSSEALLRRALRGDRFPRINSLVDVANVMSLLAQSPIGLYDLDHVEGPLTIRVGAEGEGYEGIRKDRVNVGGRLCVADAFGPCGNPSSDSARTMITTQTERAAWIWFLPVGEPAIDRTAELVAQYGRGLLSVVHP